MRLSRILLIACLLTGGASFNSAFGQFGIPKLPKFGKGNKNDPGGNQSQPPPIPPEYQQGRNNRGPQVNPPGVPVPEDSPLLDAFRKLQDQLAYHQRITMIINNPQMAQMMAQMGFVPMEILAAGDTKQISMHFKVPVMGQSEDFELVSVASNGRIGKKWNSTAKEKILKAQDASAEKALLDIERTTASSIARNAAAGPFGAISAAVSATSAVASTAAVISTQKKAHEFWEWSCMDSGVAAAAVQARQGPPPLTDLKVLGDQTLDGAAVTSYEFYVKDGSKFQGPVQVHIAKDTGLPVRLGMNDPQGMGGMQMDYFGFGQAGDIEKPGCLSK